MRTHEQVVDKLLRRPGVRKEVERIEREESALLDVLLRARHEAGLSQAQVAELMGTQAPSVARLNARLRPASIHRPSPRCESTPRRVAGVWCLMLHDKSRHLPLRWCRG